MAAAASATEKRRIRIASRRHALYAPSLFSDAAAVTTTTVSIALRTRGSHELHHAQHIQALAQMLPQNTWQSRQRWRFCPFMCDRYNTDWRGSADIAI